MAFNFKSQVAADLRQVLGANFAQYLIFTPPVGAPVTITGQCGNHSVHVDANGYIAVNTKEAHCTVSEATLLAAGYITRDSSGNILTFAGHKVTFTDVSGLTKTYVIQKGERKANESIGTLTFRLSYVEVVVPGRIIYGYSYYKLYIDIVSVVDPMVMQEIGNGDVIRRQYLLNPDRTVTMPYLALYAGIGLLAPFLINNREVSGVTLTTSTGVISNAIHNGFNVTNKLEFNARLPMFEIPD